MLNTNVSLGRCHLFYFAQHKYNTWDQLGKDWLNILDTPHYRHLYGGDDYRRYLSLTKDGREAEIDARIEKFDRLADDIAKNGIREPVQVLTRFNGDKLLFHGNHRYAVARYLGIECPIVEVGVDDYLKFNIENRKYRFGTNDAGIPYQSLFYRRHQLVTGRRTDQLERHDMIDPADLRFKRVYDFGCNMGASCILAHEAGAAVEGWDLPEFRTTAIRIALLMNYNIQYRLPQGDYDTLFLFSVHAHADIPNIKAKVVYVETHEDGVLPERFRHAKELGCLKKRKFFRAEMS